MTRFRIKPHDAPRKPQTPAQKAATQRNFAIFKLRGLWSTCGMLAEPYRSAARLAIDEDLIARGAEPQIFKEARALLTDLADEFPDAVCVEDIPY